MKSMIDADKFRYEFEREVVNANEEISSNRVVRGKHYDIEEIIDNETCSNLQFIYSSFEREYDFDGLWKEASARGRSDCVNHSNVKI